MKKNLVTIILCVVFAHAGKAQTDHAVQFANKVAQRMKDTLVLTGQQRTQIMNINTTLAEQKKAARQQYGSSSATPYIQKIENKRDSLYKLVLPADKYIIYKQKKNVLVNNN